MAASASMSTRSSPRSTPSRNKRAPALLVAAALGDELARAGPFDVAPLADEDRGHVELARHDAQVRAQSLAYPLGGRRFLGNAVERSVERARSLTHRVGEERLLRLRQRVQRPFLHAHRLRDVAHRGAVEASLGEQLRRGAHELVPSRAHGYDATDRSEGRESR